MVLTSPWLATTCAWLALSCCVRTARSAWLDAACCCSESRERSSASTSLQQGVGEWRQMMDLSMNKTLEGMLFK